MYAWSLVNRDGPWNSSSD